MADVIKYVEYIGDKEEKKYYSNLYTEKVVFKANKDFGGRKILPLDARIADECLRFPAVYREVNVSEIVRETSKGGTKKDLFEGRSDAVVAGDKDKAGKKK